MSRSRAAAASLAAAIAVVASLLAAVPAALADPTPGSALYVTQRAPGATGNVASLQLAAFGDSLSSPVFAGPGAESFGIAVTPDGAHVYVTNDNGGSSISQYSVDSLTGALTPLTPATVTVSSTPGAEPEDVTVDPTGRWAYVANPAAGSVSQLRINPRTGALTMVGELTSGLLTFPTGVAFSPDGRSLYVADFGAGDIAEFDVDPLTGALAAKADPVVAVPAPDDSNPPQPRRLVAATIAGHDHLYVSDYANGQVDEFSIDGVSGELTAGAGVGSGGSPTGLAVDTATSPASLYVAAEGSNVVDEYDIDPLTGAPTAKASSSVATGIGPDGMAIAPDGLELYVGDSADGLLNLYTIAADGTLAPDPVTAQVSVGDGPSTPVVHALPVVSSPPPAPVGGSLAQLPAPDDCLTSNLFGCGTLAASPIGSDYQTVVSPDGRDVYAAGAGGTLAEFSRDPSNGALTELGCVGDGTGVCGQDSATASNQPTSLALSADGRYLYEVDFDNSLVEFSRDPSSGLLTWLGCLSSTDSRCDGAVGLDSPEGVAVSPDGTSVYVTSSGDSSVAWFARDPSTGLLTQPGGGGDCISGDGQSNPAGCSVDSATGLTDPVTVAVSPDGANVYVSAGGLGPSGDVAEFSRDAATGALTQLAAPDDCLSSSAASGCGDTSAVGFGGEEDIALSPDGRNAYLNSFTDSAVIELSRDPATGALTQLAAPNDCITSDSANPGGCGNAGAVALNGVQGVAVSGDGLNLYAAASGPVAAVGAFNAVDELARNPLTGALSQVPAPFDCLTENGSGCATYNANGIGQPRRLAVSPDGANVYVAGQEGTVVELARTRPTANLSIAQDGAAASATVGDQITYTYTVANAGPSDAGDVLVTVPLDSEESLATAASSQGGCTGAPVVHCDLGPLAASGSATVTVVANADTPGSASVDASVAETTDAGDDDSSDNDVVTSTDIAPATPTNTSVPVVSGTAEAGQALSATSGDWTGSPGGFTYDWQDCSDGSGNGCVVVQSGASDEYTLGVADEGAFVRVVVTAAGGAAPASSVPLGPVTGAPANTGAPSVSGSASVGGTLTADPGTWSGYPAPTFTYAWQDCVDGSGDGCTTVQSGSSDQYSPAVADEGLFVQVVVTASNGVGSDASSASDAVGEVTGPPSGLSAPSISGSASVEGTLTADPGTWSGFPAPSFTYVWQDCPDASGDGCSEIAGATSSSYVPGSGDAGQTVRVVVTASNGAGPDATVASATTSAVTAAPSPTGSPVVTGTPTAGQTLNATAGSWSGYPAPSFTYSWQDCTDTAAGSCAVVQTGSSSHHTLGVTDLGSFVRVVVTASNGVGSSGSAASVTTAVVTGAPANTAAPALSGTASAGQTLTVSPGTWSGYPAPSFTYAWQDCPDSSGNGCATVQSGASSQYTLGGADEGSLVRVVVTATNSAGHAAAASGYTTAVTGPPVDSVPPSVTGSPVAGQTLNASPGTWSGQPAPSFTYRWQDCPDSSGNGCHAIAGALSSSYVLAASDEGFTVRVVVTASNGVGSNATLPSATTAVVTGTPANTAPPAVSGTVSAGQTLNVSAGTWTGYPAPAFSYAWQDCPDSSGNGCTTVQTGSGAQYALGTADEGAFVRVVVTASNGVGPNPSATSAQVGRVTGAPAHTALPVVSGTPSAGHTLSATAGSWTGFPAPAFSYAWQDCATSGGSGCATVATGPSNQYLLTAADAGSFVRVIVTASNGVGSDATATSATTAAVTQAPVNGQAPSISGTAEQGMPLSGNAGTWNGVPTPALSFQWEDCDASGNACAPVAAGGQGLQYVPTAADVGSTLVLSVTATNSAGQATSASASTPVVAAGPPASQSPPAVTGTAQQGATLQASTGTWSNSPVSFTYAWQRCDDSGNSCTAISGAATSSYVASGFDVGSTLRVIVTASNAAGPASATSAQTAVVLIAAPVNTLAPVISGTAGVGQLLTTSNGLWMNAPTSFTYRWRQCDSAGANCADIAGATSGNYVSQAGDVGHTLTVIVTAHNAGGTGAGTSAASAVIGTMPANTAPPAITGTAQQGQALTVGNGTWTGTPAPAFTYQWQRCDAAGNACAAIAGATASAYAPVAGDIGHRLRAVVTASNTAGGAAATSAASAAVMIGAPGNAGAPAIAGSAQPGQTLTASPGSWTNSPASFGYQWSRCDGAGNGCTAIAGATGTGYLIGAADTGHTLRVTVSASNAGGTTAAASPPSQVVSSLPPSNTAAPGVSGTAKQGQALSAANGGWTNSPSSYGYQWSQCDGSGGNCAPIAGATAPAYTPGSGDVGHTLRVTVTAANSSGSSTATSAQSAVVAASSPSNTAPPAITGTAEQGQSLSLSNGGWSGAPTSFDYQWLRCNSAGTSCSAIAGATGNKYVPAAADGGHTLKAKVTASNAAGSASATSPHTDVVGALQVSIAPPLLGQTTNLAPAAGTVLVKLPGSKTFTKLTTATDLPFGSTIDARLGKVTLTVALPHGRTQTGDFYQGEFVLTQAGSGMTILTLAGGSFAGCPAPSPQNTGAAGTSSGGAVASSAKKKTTTVVRQLWGDAHGQYTTKGRYGSASVSGTVWLTQDRCDGTYIKVTKDNVIAVAYAHPHTKQNVKQGHSILIPPPAH